MASSHSPAPRSSATQPPQWVEHGIIWQIYPLGFTGAPVRPTEQERQLLHRLGHIEQWLDYAVDLGVNIIQFGPLFSSRTHGYDTEDFYSIDPRLGSMEDFVSLVDACHDRGLKVVLDGVFNHVGSGYPHVESLASGEVFEGHGDLVELDHTQQEVKDLVTSVMRFWLEKGIDGWRLDAAYAVDPDFWRPIVESVRRDYPQAWWVGEVIHGDYPQYVANSSLDSVTQYEVWKAVWSSIKEKNFFELEWSLRRHNDFLESFLPLTFVGNHDVTRIASQVGERGALIAHSLLLLLGGVPSIYYGDEQLFRGVKEEREGGDDAVRPMFPAGPGELADSGWEMYHRMQALIAIRRQHPFLQWAVAQATTVENTRLQLHLYPRQGHLLGAAEDSWVDIIVSVEEDEPAVRIFSAAGELFSA